MPHVTKYKDLPIGIKAQVNGTCNELVDILFSCVLHLHADKKRFAKMTREEVAEWTARQLKEMGYPTRPSGACWGRLVDNNTEGLDI